MTLRGLAWSIPGHVGVMLLVALGRGLQWRGEWMSTADALLFSTTLVGPVLACVSAWGAFQQQRLDLLVASSSRAGLSITRVALLAWMCALTGWGMVAAMMVLATTVRVGGTDVISMWPVVLSVPVLLAVYSFLGAVAGALLPHWVTVVLVGPLLFGLVLAMESRAFPNMLGQGGAFGSLAGLNWNTPLLVYQMVGALGLILALVMVPLAFRPVSPMGVGVIGLAVLVSTGAIAAIENVDEGDPWRYQVDPRPTACVGHAPEVCVAAEHGWIAVAVRSGLLPVAEELRSAGAEIPERFVEQFAFSVYGPEDAVFHLDSLAGDIDSAVAIGMVLRPSGCVADAFSDVDGPPSDRVYDVVRYIENWLRMRLGLSPDPWDRTEASWLRDVPAVDQERWVREVYRDLRLCNFHDLSLPNSV